MLVAVRSGVLTIKLNSPEAAAVRRALAADQRIKLLEILAARTMNVNEIAAALGVSHPTASLHIKALQDAGLLESAYASTDKGSEKRCWTAFNQIVFEFEAQEEISTDSAQEVTVPVGLYSAAKVLPPCGLLGRKSGLTSAGHPLMTPERELAHNLWFSGGWVEYSFPFQVPASSELVAVEFEAEVCSEAPGYNVDYPSDITVWFNGLEVGTWTSPGDFGGRRGKLNPAWLPDSFSQFGMLKSWKVDTSGCYLDNREIGSTKLADLLLTCEAPLTVRIGVKEDAVNQGGVNLFGKCLGDYPQDLMVRYLYTLPE